MFSWKSLTNTLFTVLGGVLLFASCSSPQTAQPTPMVSKSSSVTESQIKPTPLATPISPYTPRSTPTVVSTPLPTLPTLPFPAWLIQPITPNCDVIVTLPEFSRIPDSGRRGWDRTEGFLRYHPMPECGLENMNYNPYSSGDPRFISFILSKDPQTFSKIRFNATWEGEGYVDIVPVGGGSRSNPFGVIEIPFSFDIPHNAQQLRLGYNLDISEKATPTMRNDLSKRITGSLSLQPVDSTTYANWISERFSRYFIGNVINEKYLQSIIDNQIGKDAAFRVTELKKSPDEITLSIELTNKSFTHDLNIPQSGFYIYATLDEIGKLVYFAGKGHEPVIQFDPQIGTLPPGYSAKSTLRIKPQFRPTMLSGELAHLPTNSVYLVGKLLFTGKLPYDVNRDSIDDANPLLIALPNLMSPVTFSPTTTPTPTQTIVPTPTPRFGSVKVYVWWDTNGNGIRESSETNADAGAVVDISGVDACSRGYSANTATRNSELLLDKLPIAHGCETARYHLQVNKYFPVDFTKGSYERHFGDCKDVSLTHDNLHEINSIGCDLEVVPDKTLIVELGFRRMWL